MSNNETNGERYLCFSLGEETFAIPLLSVREVIAVPEITRVPQTPPHFMGIMNLRGQVISVIDLRNKLSIKPKANAETAIIICDLGDNSVGVVVDSINSVLHPSPEEVTEKPEIQSQRNTDYIKGVYRMQNELVLLLDIAQALSLGDHQLLAKSSVQKAA